MKTWMSAVAKREAARREEERKEAARLEEERKEAANPWKLKAARLEEERKEAVRRAPARKEAAEKTRQELYESDRRYLAELQMQYFSLKSENEKLQEKLREVIREVSRDTRARFYMDWNCLQK